MKNKPSTPTTAETKVKGGILTVKRMNRIWIELDKQGPEDESDRGDFMRQQCDLANKVMAKLGDMSGRKFFVMNRSGREGAPLVYCFGGNMGYKELADRGEWFNLDYLSKSTRAQRTGTKKGEH